MNLQRLARLTIWLLVVTVSLAGCAVPVPRATPTPLALSPTAPATSVATAMPASTAAPAADGLLHETRALWTWVGSTAKSRADVDKLVAQVDAAHLNVILFGIYRSGTAYFQPSVTRFPDPKERLVSQTKFKDDEYPDALSYLLALRDQRRADSDPTNDFEVHAWFTVNQGGAASDDWPPESEVKPYMLNALFPEFMVKSGRYYTENDPRFINPAASAVEEPRFRQYMVDLITGLAEDYPVDGVHLDYIRIGALCFNNEVLTYSDPKYYFPGCQADYEEWTAKTYGKSYDLLRDTDGDRAIRDGNSGRVEAWQVYTVGLLVKAIHDSVKTARPNDIISVASVRNVPWELPVQGQTAWDWLDKGWIDAIFPTLYLDGTQPIVDRVGKLREAVTDSSKRDLIFAGIATHDFDNPNGSDWAPLVLERVNALMRATPSDQALAPTDRGVALFRSEYFTPATIAALANGPFRQPAVPYWGNVATGDLAR